MRNLFLITTLCIISLSIYSQEKLFFGVNAEKLIEGAKEIRYSSSNKIPYYIEFKKSEGPNAENWLEFVIDKFDLNNEFSFQLISETTDKVGQTHSRYQVVKNGYPISFTHLIIHSKNNEVLVINGNMTSVIYNNSKAKIQIKEAINIGKQDMNASIYKWEVEEEEEHLKVEQRDINATYYPKGELVWFVDEESKNASLCRKVNIYAIDPLGRVEYYVDANSGIIKYKEELIHTTNKPGIANTAYSGPRAIVSDSVGDPLYRLRENSRGNGIETYDLNKSTRHAQGIDFFDTDNVWNNVNADLDQYAGDAHWGAEKMYDYLDSVHNRNSIDGVGFALLSYVHYGNNYNNAFWDGQRMTYGDGNQVNTPLTSIDIAGHEIAHGLTNFTAGLRYRSESGGLNESFSDIFGAALENFGRPGNWNWLLGEDIGGAFRSMSNPNLYGHPDTYDGTFWIDQNCTPTNTNDWCGVHTNSGVQNYWFYLLTIGGSGVNDIGSNFSVNGIGIDKAAKIAFRNLTVYLTPNSNYADARFYAIKSAIDLYGGCSPEVESTTNAWYAVGVGNEYRAGVQADFFAAADTLYCSLPASVSFTNNSNNVSVFNWRFGDGNISSSPNPVNVYVNPGLYTVSLFADGGICGADTLIKTSYINVDTSATCSYSMDENSTRTLNECSGSLFDNGGLNGDYALNSYDTVIISPSNSDYIELSFSQLNVESGYNGYCNHDYIELFDGPNTESPSLGRFCSSILPPNIIRSTGSIITIILSSDNMVSNPGFIMNWECKSSTILPVASYQAKFDSTCNGYNEFYNTTLNGSNSWLWSFGDGVTSTEMHPSHTYENNGAYIVSLTSTNSIGSNTQNMASIIVDRPSAPITNNDTACVGGDYKLAATGLGNLNWFNSKSGNLKVFTGDTLKINNVMNDTNFFVSSTVIHPRVIGTPIVISGTTFRSDTTAELYLDVYKPTLLESVIVNSNKVGVRRIDLKNSLGQIIESRNVNVPNVPSQVQLNIEIPKGNGYSLSIGNRDPSLLVNLTGAVYPYPFSNFMSVTGSSLGSTAYPFFYYMIAREIECISPFSEVKGLIDTSCVITSVNEINDLESLSVYPNPFKDNFTIVKSNNKKYSFQLFDLVGKLFIEKHDVLSKSEIVSISQLPKGVYILKLTDGIFIKTEQLIKQ